MTEQEWQSQVVEAAHLYGWAHLHIRRTIGRKKQWTTSTNVKGWPDLFMWHPHRGFLAVELKVRPNTATPEQVAVLASLQAAGAQTLIAYPSDWDVLVSLLSGRPIKGAA